MSIKEQAFDAAHREILKLKNEILEELKNFISIRAVNYYDTLGKDNAYVAESINSAFENPFMTFCKNHKLSVLLNKLYYSSIIEYNALVSSLDVGENIQISRSTKVYQTDWGATETSVYTISWS